MAGSCYVGRRLRELLQEQQEPFLLPHAATEAAPPCCFVAEDVCRRLCVYGSKNGDATRRRSALGRAVRRAVRLAGCFPYIARESFFRQLTRAGDTRGSHCDDVVTGFDDGDHGARRLSPVSVLDVLRYYSDEELSSPTLSHWEDGDDDKLCSDTSGSSPSPDLLSADDKTAARAAEEATTTSGGQKNKSTEEEEQKIVSSWERIAGDIARVPALAELDLCSSRSAPEWRRLWLGEATRVGASIEAMIFEEVRAEVVRDMLGLPQG